MSMEKLRELKDELNESVRELGYQFWLLTDDAKGEYGLWLTDVAGTGSYKPEYKKMSMKGGYIDGDYDLIREKMELFLSNIEHYRDWLRLARLIKFREYEFNLDDWYFTVHRGHETLRTYTTGKTYTIMVSKSGNDDIIYDLTYDKAHDIVHEFLTKSMYV